jgi:hypothetical protein
MGARMPFGLGKSVRSEAAAVWEVERRRGRRRERAAAGRRRNGEGEGDGESVGALWPAGGCRRECVAAAAAMAVAVAGGGGMGRGVEEEMRVTIRWGGGDCEAASLLCSLGVGSIAVERNDVAS